MAGSHDGPSHCVCVGSVKQAMAATLANYDSSNQRKVLGIVRTVKDEVLLGLMLVIAVSAHKR